MEKEKKNVLYGAADEILLEEIKQYKVMRNDFSLLMSCYKSYGRENRFDPVTFKKECRGAIHKSKVKQSYFACLVIRLKELAPLSLNQ